MDLGLSGYVMAVTGGSSGIGLATVKRLLDEGARVITCARGEQRLRAETEDLPEDRLEAVRADIDDPAQAEQFVEQAVSKFGRLDGLVAAAGGDGIHGHALELPPADWSRQVNRILGLLLNALRPAREHLVDSAGSVVAIAAPTGRDPRPEMAAVSAARAAIGNLMQSLAVDLAVDGVRVNAVGVGLTDTALQLGKWQSQQPTIDRDYRQWLATEAKRRGVPLGRAANADEVADAIVLLLSPRLGFTTGAILPVTGGLPT